MNRTVQRLGQGLLGIGLGLIVLSCGGGQTAVETADQRQLDWEDQVREVVADETRAEAVLAASAEFRDLANEAREQAISYRQRFRALNANYDASREDFEALLGEDEAERHALRDRLFAVRDAMIENTTDEEWETLRDSRADMYEAAAVAALEAALPNHDRDRESEPESELEATP